MTGAPLEIRNRDARRLWLASQGLAATPTGPLDLAALIRDLGFVQLDSIRVVARAHHHIIWSRNQNYREPMLDALMRKDRGVFEHFTHDASVIPMEFYPMWRRQFRRLEEKVRGWEWHRGMLDAKGRNAIVERIRNEGPLSTKAFDTKIEGPREMWRRPPHKLSLDYLWYAGDLSTSHRENFTKFYDLTERVIPSHHRDDEPPESDQVDWLCREALGRLGFGSEGDIQRFWAAADLAEVKDWAGRQKRLVPVRVETHDGAWINALAPPDIEQRLESAPAATSRLRILNPFDPVIRDRARLQRLFGFDYRIEIFVPAAKRIWGYYVYPLLEGDRMVGRIEAKADRAAGTLTVDNLWAEPGVQWTSARAAKLDAELARFARLAGVDSVVRNDRLKLDFPQQ
ncbi:MAG: YcaQ family DNA glycosylase [Hyphomonas sp.]|nr:YcaQ family DNA glycosylase [Hyphomonas sp.]